MEVVAAVAGDSGWVLRRAVATTCSERASSGRTVRMQAPKSRQTSLGVVAESRPLAMNQPGGGDGRPRSFGARRSGGQAICGGWRGGRVKKSWGHACGVLAGTIFIKPARSVSGFFRGVEESRLWFSGLRLIQRQRFSMAYYQVQTTGWKERFLGGESGFVW